MSVCLSICLSYSHLWLIVLYVCLSTHTCGWQVYFSLCLSVITYDTPVVNHLFFGLFHFNCLSVCYSTHTFGDYFIFLSVYHSTHTFGDYFIFLSVYHSTRTFCWPLFFVFVSVCHSYSHLWSTVLQVGSVGILALGYLAAHCMHMLLNCSTHLRRR